MNFAMGSRVCEVRNWKHKWLGIGVLNWSGRPIKAAAAPASQPSSVRRTMWSPAPLHQNLSQQQPVGVGKDGRSTLKISPGHRGLSTDTLDRGFSWQKTNHRFVGNKSKCPRTPPTSGGRPIAFAPSSRGAAHRRHTTQGVVPMGRQCPTNALAPTAKGPTCGAGNVSWAVMRPIVRR